MTTRRAFHTGIAGAGAGMMLAGGMYAAAQLGAAGWLGAAAGMAALGALIAATGLRWREESLVDGATGLFNRRYMLARLQAELRRERATRRPLSFVVLEIDDMKRCNDRFGHLAGDALLYAVARELRAVVRPSDTVVRWGGDEFGVILPEAGTAQALLIAERLRQHIEALDLDVGQGRRLRTTVSVGVASQAAAGEALDLIERADRAMYSAKRQKNQVALAG